MTGLTSEQLAVFRPVNARDYAAIRTALPGYRDWLDHVRAAAACTRPIRLIGDLFTVRGTGDGGAQAVAQTGTEHMPDGAIYKACGNRRASVCPACARVYQRDAYQILHTMLVGGKGVTPAVADHPAAFLTLTAPSFGTVHTRTVSKHTCANRRRCTCRPDPCHPRRAGSVPGLCPHGNPAVCWARHEPDDPVLGKPLCLDCYDHDHHVIWNIFSGELWRRTSIAATRYLATLCRQRGIPFHVVFSANGKPRYIPPVRLCYGKAAEYQARGAVHFHALIRLDGLDPYNPAAVVPPPAGLTATDLHDALTCVARQTAFTSPYHPDRPSGWSIAWGEQLDVQPISLTGEGDVTDTMAAGYLAKYATKSTEVTGHRSARLYPDTIDLYADPDGDHNARLIDACWRLGRPTHIPQPLATRPRPARPARPVWQPWTCPDCGTRTRLAVCSTCTEACQPEVDTKSVNHRRPNPYARLRRAAHMLGFGGHFLTKARHHRVTFTLLRDNRIIHRRAESAGPIQPIRTAEHLTEETTLIVGVLTFAGVGWHNTGDAMLANTSAAMARARHEAAREELAHEVGASRTLGVAA